MVQGVRNGLDQVAGLAGDTRRMVHGGSAWSLPRGLNGLRQPQDGAPTAVAVPPLERKRAVLLEPEDAGMTGGTRSLTRRLLGLNVADGPRRPAAVAASMTRRAA
jgi:hypothetical protein